MHSSQLAVHPIGAFAENRGSDADVGGPFLDGHFEIPAHAHAEKREGNPGFTCQIVAQIPQIDEPMPGGLGIRADGWDGHQSEDFEALHGKQVIDFRAEGFGFEAAFAGFSADVDL